MGEKSGLSIGLLYEALYGIILQVMCNWNIEDMRKERIAKLVASLLTTLILGVILLSVVMAILKVSNMEQFIMSNILLVVLPFLTILVIQIVFILCQERV